MTAKERIAAVRADQAGEPISANQAGMALAQLGRTRLDAMVDRFLSWPLPESVCADGCATNRDYPHPRSGTNLLTAVEARQMLEHVLSGASVPSAIPRIADEFSEFIGRLSDLAHSADFWADKPYGNRLYYGAGAGEYIAGDILQAFLHALKTNAAPQAPAVTGKAPSGLTATEQPAGVAPLSDIGPTDEDAERYRWFRNECAWFRRADIVEVAGEDAAMLDHHIDKGRCGL